MGTAWGWQLSKKEYLRDKPVLGGFRLNFLLGCGDNSLSDFELARLAEVANLRTDLHVILDKLIDEMAQAAIAAWFRQTNRETLKQAIQSPEEHTAEIMAWARERIRSQGKEGEEKVQVPRTSLAPGEAHLAAALRYQKRNIAEGKCSECPKPLARNSVRYCEKHLAMTRSRASQKKALSLPGSREYLYAGELPESTHGRQPGTLASLAMHREQKTRAVLAELGIPPESAAVSVKAAKEAIMRTILRCLSSRGGALTQAQLFEKAMIPTKTTSQKALKELLSTDQIKRIGKGIKADPYRYFVGAKGR